MMRSHCHTRDANDKRWEWVEALAVGWWLCLRKGLVFISTPRCGGRVPTNNSVAQHVPDRLGLERHADQTNEPEHDGN